MILGPRNGLTIMQRFIDHVTILPLRNRFTITYHFVYHVTALIPRIDLLPSNGLITALLDYSAPKNCYSSS